MITRNNHKIVNQEQDELPPRDRDFYEDNIQAVDTSRLAEILFELARLCLAFALGGGVVFLWLVFSGMVVVP